MPVYIAIHLVRRPIYEVFGNSAYLDRTLHDVVSYRGTVIALYFQASLLASQLNGIKVPPNTDNIAK